MSHPGSSMKQTDLTMSRSRRDNPMFRSQFLNNSTHLDTNPEIIRSVFHNNPVILLSSSSKSITRISPSIAPSPTKSPGATPSAAATRSSTNRLPMASPSQPRSSKGSSGSNRRRRRSSHTDSNRERTSGSTRVLGFLCM